MTGPEGANAQNDANAHHDANANNQLTGVYCTAYHFDVSSENENLSTVVVDLFSTIIF